MKHLRPSLLLFLAAAPFLAPASFAAPPPEYPPHTVPGTILRVLPRTRDDRLYQLHISLPADAGKHPGKKYPVVLVTDGYWDFTTVVAAYGNFFYGKNVPEMIVVGLGYAGENLNYDAMRVDDLCPMGAPGSGSGHAEAFLHMIETVALPLLEKEYGADPKHRYLMGCSNGGLFTLYTLFTRPELFQGYVADSPAVSSVLPYERAFVESGRTTQARVYLAAAENEWPVFRDSIRAFHRQLEKDGVVKGGLKFKLVEGVRHAGGKPDTYSHGLLFVTEPIAPETGVQKDFLGDPGDRRPFAIDFRPAHPEHPLSPADQQALRDHEAWLREQQGQGRSVSAATNPADASKGFSQLILFAPERLEAESLAKSAPAVKAGLLQYAITTIQP